MNDCHARRRLGGSLNAGRLLFEVRGETSLPTPHPGCSAFNDAEGRNGEHADDQGERPVPHPAIPIEPSHRSECAGLPPRA